jgi:hypothetical protein
VVRCPPDFDEPFEFEAKLFCLQSVAAVSVGTSLWQAQCIVVGLVKEMMMKTIANENEHPDHLQLKQLLEEAKPLMLPMYPDQQKVWVAESPLAQEIKSILAKHPEYYAEVRAVVGGVFPEANS